MTLWMRSIAFCGLFYLWSLLLVLLMIPLVLAPVSWILWAMTVWARGATWLLAFICKIRMEVRGRENIPPGPVLIAGKHQCMFDTIGPFVVLPRAAFVMKAELLSIPFYGWYSRKARMIAVDREAHSAALRSLVAQARRRAAEGRQIVIFPEGSRLPPGETGDYKPGVAGLYRDLGLPCVPMATNSGLCWPAHGFLRRPGVIVYEFLDPIAPGLHRGAFMRRLQEDVESASKALL